MGLQIRSEQVRIETDLAVMEGVLWLPEDCIGVILFAHGGAPSRTKPLNDYVGSVLRSARLGTLWLDLLTPQESASPTARSDVKLLAARLNAACDWLQHYDSIRDLPLGLYGSGPCAAAALYAAAEHGSIAAVVSRSGRPGVADHGILGRVGAPTLLIVGGLDDGAIGPNRSAYRALHCKKRFEIIPGATQAFDEPGSLEVAARLARGWFLQHAKSAYA